MTEKRISKWPFLWGVLLYGANVDYIIIPLVLQPLGLSFWSIFWIANLIANAEIVGGFYFWQWLAWKWMPTTEPVKKTVRLAKTIVQLLKEEGLIGAIIYKIQETFEWAKNPDGRLMELVKKWGRLGMLGLGALSFSGGRLAGTIICASTKWKTGIYLLIIGNVVHIAASVWMWKLFFYLWYAHRIELIFIVILSALFFARGFIWKKLRIAKDSPKSP